jgi:hypothetical protein
LSSKSLLNFVKKAPLTHIQITMKLVSASVLFLGSVMADKWSHLGDLWQQLGQANNVGEDDRKIIELFTISSVANYGCWCRFGQYRPYKGQAQDVVDEACKTWHQNYDCLNIDYNTDGTTPCNMDTEYNDVIVSISDPFDMATDYAAACDTANPGNACASEACHVDAVFIREVVLFLADNTLNMTLSGWYGFDGAVCTGATAAGTTLSPPVAPTTLAPETTGPPETTLVAPLPATQCCGAYPNRFPYKTQNGGRQCCVDTTYNPLLLECCASGSLANLGTC